MQSFRKKPVVIRAFQWNPDVGLPEEAEQHPQISRPEGFETLEIETLEGVMTAFPGDWIIFGIRDEPYPCKPDIFEETYEVYT